MVSFGGVEYERGMGLSNRNGDTLAARQNSG